MGFKYKFIVFSTLVLVFSILNIFIINYKTKDRILEYTSMIASKVTKYIVNNAYVREKVNYYANDIYDIVKDNSNVRIVEDRNIKSVSYEYFDDEIIDILANQKSTRIIDLTYELSNKYHINDSVFVFLISRLIIINSIF